MKIDKINSYNFNILNKKPCRKNQEVSFCSKNHVSSPVEPKYWQAAKLSGNLENLYNICWIEGKPVEQNILLAEELSQKKPEWLKEVEILQSLPYFQLPTELLLEKMPEFMETKSTLERFLMCFIACNEGKEFDHELFKQAVEIEKSPCKDIDTTSAINAIKNLKSADSLPAKEQIKTLVQLKNIDKDLILKFGLVEEINKLEHNISSVDLNEIDAKDKKAFFENFFKIPSSNELSPFEKTMQDSIPLLKSFAEGLPLKYSRSEFLKDLEALNLDEKDYSKLQITPEFVNDNLIGYEGFISLKDIDPDTKLYDICHRFLFENKVQTGDEKLDEELNMVIKGVPEFINIIGKTQHKTHNYSLDIHSLLVLANSINNPQYKNLNASDRAVLKIACLTHDSAKKEGEVDKEHQIPSALYAKSIASRYFKEPETIDRIYELIKNHHWLEEFNNADDKKAIRKLAFNFRRKNDFELAKIFARADLKSVSDEFYSNHKDALDDIGIIEENINKIYETASALFVDSINKNCIPLENFKGYDYRVLNFNETDDKEDLSKYGFEKGKTKKDVRFLVHMVEERGMKANLETLNFLTSSLSESALSESMISLEKSATYDARKFGVILSELNPNIITTEEYNQSSGYEKVYNDILELIFEDDDYARNNFKNSVLKRLEADCSDEEYAKFYKENLASKTRLSQIKDYETFTLSNKTFSGKELKQAIVEFQDSLLNNSSNNEIVGCTPKIRGVIAKANSLEEVPTELLEFARENDLPVILINNDEDSHDFY